MKSMRYIVTRPCLQEGSLSILKYLQSTFPQSGPAVFVDDKGEEHTVQVDTERARVWGLGGLYHAQHLGVNDVLILTNLAPARFQVEAIVKPHAPPPLPRREQSKAPETRRVVVSSTAHVREVRMQEVTSQQAEAQPTPPAETSALDSDSQEIRVTELRPSHAERAAEARVSVRKVSEQNAPELKVGEQTSERTRADRRGTPLPTTSPTASSPLTRVGGETSRAEGRAGAATGTLATTIPATVVAPSVSTELHGAEAQLAELARLTGYRLDNLGGGVLRLKAELGAHGYAVLVAMDEAARTAPAWNEEQGYRVLLCSEDQHPENVSRLTHEALAALNEHARLAPLSPIDLRGYWKAGHVDLESAASIAELVSAHLAQRGIFSFVLLTLAQQPAHSVISVPRLAEKLGSGVNYAELGSILETLTRAPFLALTPLPGGQFLLRTDVADILTDLAEYSDGVRRRIRTPAAAGAVRRESVRG
ncbi:hypothetical protein [Deinococcus humi]|uniref:Uncharacterized protein n=1 Tax=Deinococcus humi TaxID=662880 RepID=A0A7W8JVW0_9DEIO|nr:hypothetical protein [Deinococcus humi]MBB5364197.1 hypothetical protein [Deinococcus humi]GGO38561.1 hypothetical protein GCM10008949_45310 [Deinococcus humi]